MRETLLSFRLVKTTCFVWKVRATVSAHKKNLIFFGLLNANGFLT